MVVGWSEKVRITQVGFSDINYKIKGGQNTVVTGERMYKVKHA